MEGEMFEAWNYGAKIEDMVGRVFVSVVRGKENEGDESIVFTEADGTRWMFAHAQDCCESVTIEDVSGDLSDLTGVPLLRAEESASSEPSAEVVAERAKCRAETMAEYGYEPEDPSETWTYYKFGTVKGDVDVRWYGESNGYYSERVDLCRYPA